MTAKKSAARGTGKPGATARSAKPAQEPAAAGALDDIRGILESWAPTIGRVLLGLVLAWFGYHELVQPALWTGYVPFAHSASAGAIILVLAHGWLLLVTAVALIAGIMTRAAASVAALLLAEIVIWLTISAGLSDLTLRDVGVLGLALCLCGATRQRLTLSS
jgi:uncharacterized membrane protein YphA (DoxX/SURF4 family)